MKHLCFGCWHQEEKKTVRLKCAGLHRSAEDDAEGADSEKADEGVILKEIDGALNFSVT